VSRTKPSELQQVQLLVPCSYCRANVGHWCRVAAGHWVGDWATTLHAARWWAIQPYVAPVIREWDRYLSKANEEAWAWRQAAIKLGHGPKLTEAEARWPPSR
jgi:hypothetical protein